VFVIPENEPGLIRKVDEGQFLGMGEHSVTEGHPVSNVIIAKILQVPGRLIAKT
jgi:hypothetical protein